MAPKATNETLSCYAVRRECGLKLRSDYAQYAEEWKRLDSPYFRKTLSERGYELLVKKLSFLNEQLRDVSGNKARMVENEDRLGIKHR